MDTICYDPLPLRVDPLVGRRVKVLTPSSPFFTFEQKKTKSGKVKGEDGTGKVAAGIEVQYVITFSPNSRENYSCDLVVVTEREKFLVPLRASGCKGALDFPDQVHFETTAVKDTNTKSFLVRNIGTKSTAFLLEASSPFSVQPSEGKLEIGEIMQCSLTFCPHMFGLTRGELLIKYDTGEVVWAELTGEGEESEVRLSDTLMELQPTFINKTSQKTFKIVNDSNQVINFALKLHEYDEEDERMRVQQSLSLSEREAGEAQLQGINLVESDEEVELEDELEDEEKVLGNSRVHLSRKFKQMQKAAASDKVLFKHGSFSLAPLEGVVWPSGEVEVMVQFHPKNPYVNEATVYCELSGRVGRQPITLRATGVGPKAVFSYDILDVGDTFINSVHQYEVELHNRGEIEAEFRLLRTDSVFGKKFQFEPDTGVLAVGQVQSIGVMFSSDVLGEFAEPFHWQIKGSSENLCLDFRGRVVGPTFHLDVEELDFGIVSFGYRYTKTFTIHNTSEIPMKFSMRIPEDLPDAREFQCLPVTGMILPEGKQQVCLKAPGCDHTPCHGVVTQHPNLAGAKQHRQVTLEFVSRTVKKYECTLCVDVPGVGDGLQHVPILGECCVPKVLLMKEVLDFGECFLRYNYTQPLKITNDSKLPAKFEVLPQDEQSQGLAVYTAEPVSGGIPARGSVTIDFHLATERMGGIHLPVRVQITGSKMPPLELVLAANSKGPILTFGSESGVPQPDWNPTIDFGKTDVLTRVDRKLFITNSSLIPAEFKTFISGKDSTFEVDVREATLAPGEEIALTISTYLDETQRFKDVLHILVIEGNDTAVPLEALGIGSTVICDEDLTTMNFGPQFTNRPFMKEIVLQNMGRRSQQLQWLNYAAEAAKRSKFAAGVKKKGEPEPEEEEIVFSIVPERVVIQAKQSCLFTITGNCTKPLSVSEEVVCRATIGKSSKIVQNTMMLAEVTTPYLDFSTTAISYVYSYEPQVPLMPQHAPLTLRNVTKLPLGFSIRTAAPFSVDRPDWLLEPNEGATISVIFDAGFRPDRISTTVKNKLTISYHETPHKDTIDLTGEINYPNLTLSTHKIDFGSALNDTTKRTSLYITNVSKVDCKYNWLFVEDEENGAITQGVGGKLKKSQPKLRSSMVFDMLPVCGLLKPGESETVEVSFYAHQNMRANTTAVCEVEGGPDYEIVVGAESSTIKYLLDQNVIDFGQQLFSKSVDKELWLFNGGKVPFNFKVNLSTLKRRSVCDVSPLSGTLGPNEKQNFKLKVVPGIPDKISEKFLVEVAHFEPAEVELVGEGVYPCILLSLPRLIDEEYAAFMQEARCLLIENGPRGVLANSKPAKKSGKMTLPMSSRPMSSTSSRSGAGETVGSETARTAGAQQLLSARSATAMTATSRRQSAMPQQSSAQLTSGASGYNPSERDVEMEADRLSMCNFLMNREQEMEERRAEEVAAAEAAAALETQQMASMAPPSGALDMKPASPPKKKKVRSTKPAPVVLSRYLCDFGNVTKGTHKVKKLRLQNVGAGPVSVYMDKKALPPGVTVEPDSIVRLPGAPDFETVDMVFTFQTSALDPGQIDTVFPMEIRNGPKVLVSIRANVVRPEIEVSSSKLDFGNVQVGHCRRITIQLFNPREVNAEWHIKKPMDGAKDWSFFRCEPASGMLVPGERQFMNLYFEPTWPRPPERLHYSQVIPIRVTFNKRDVKLECTGLGFMLGLRLEPPVLDLAPILPSAEKPNEAFFTMINDSHVPIEVFSLDVDKQYLEDEEILREAEGYAEQDRMLLEPREAGSGLWPDIIEADLARKEEARLAEEEAERLRLEAEEAEAKGLPPPGSEPPPEEPEPENPVPVEGEEGAVGELEAPIIEEPIVEEPDPSTYIMLVGPPLAGKTGQAQEIVRKYGVVQINVDDVISEIMAGGSPLGEQVKDHRLGKNLPVEEPPAVEEVKPPSPPKTPSKGKKGKGKEPEPAAAAAPQPPKPKTPPIQPLTVELIAEVLRERLARPDCMERPGAPGTEAGAVFDGFSSQFAAPEVITQAILLALNLRKEDAVIPEGVELPEEKPPTPKGGKGSTPKGGKDKKGKGKGGKPATPPPAQEEVKPFVYHGAKKLLVMKMPLEVEDMVNRDRVKVAAETAAAAAAAAAADGFDGHETHHFPEPEPEPEPSPFAAEDGEDAVPPEPEAEPEPKPRLYPEEDPPEPQEPWVPARQEEMEAYQELSAVLYRMFGVPTTIDATTRVEVHELQQVIQPLGDEPDQVAEEKTPEEIALQIEEKIPAKKIGWELVVPGPVTFQIQNRPGLRPGRPPVQHFQLLTPPTPEEEAAAAEAAKRPPSPAVPAGKGAKGKPVEKEPSRPATPADVDPDAPRVYTDEELSDKSRWVIPPESEIKVMVRFTSDQIGKITEMLGFEVLGGEKNAILVTRGECAYPQISTDYRNVFYRKVRQRPMSANVQRQYIISRGVFEFGPLLVGKSRENILDDQHPENKDMFRITNNGLFDCHVEFSFKGLGGTAGENGTSTVFHLDPMEMDLAVEETQDLTIYAMPNNVGMVEDTLVCTITDNPEPVEFFLSAVGAKPVIELDVENLEFERLLVDHKDAMKFTIKNVCLLPIKWTIKGFENMPEEFSIEMTEGMLEAREEITLTVTFHAMEKAVFDEQIKVSITDIHELLGVAQEIDLPIHAEAYKIEVDVKYPGEGSGLDYGVVKVVEDDLKEMAISNTGKYQVGFKFNIKKAATAELFTIEPSEGAIEPGEELPIIIHFNKERTLKREVNLKGNTDISLSIIETLTGNKEDSATIKVDLRAVFTKYTISPVRGINFGPLVYNTTSNPRTFEICNTGEFPFDFSIGPLHGDDNEVKEAAPPPVAPPPAKGGKGGAAAGAPAPAGTVKLGNFNITPSAGTVEVGAMQQVTVTFNAQAQRTYVEPVGIEITDRDMADCPGGIPYEIAGESCIPGINTEDVMAIFEEHKIVSTLDAFSIENNVFSVRDRVFSFGAVIAHMVTEEEEESKPPEKGDKNKPGEEKERPNIGAKANFKISNPNKVPCSVKLSLTPRQKEEDSANEQFPMEIHPEQVAIPPHEHRFVTLYFQPRAMHTYSAHLEAVVDNGSDPKTKQFTCEVRGEGTLPHLSIEQPTKINDEGSPWMEFPRLLLGKSHTMSIELKNNGIIPATARMEMGKGNGIFTMSSGALSKNFTLESKRGTSFQVTFTPAETRMYQHQVDLMVKHNQYETQRITITGECYMEDVTFNGLPDDYDDELHFQDGPVGVPSEVGFTLKNHTDKDFRFEWPQIDGFTLVPSCGHLHAHTTKDVLFKFLTEEPVEHRPLEMPLKLEQVIYEEGQRNDWDDRMVNIKYVPLEDLNKSKSPEPEPEPEPDVKGKKGKEDKGKKGKKGKDEEPETAKKEKKGKRGSVIEPEPEPEPELVIDPSDIVTGEDGEQLVRVTEVEPEPAHTVVEESLKELPLKVFMVADNARYECDHSTEKPVTFRPTMMYQARTYTFPLKNTSTAQMEFAWSIVPAPEDSPVPVTGDGSQQPPMPYTVTPTSGLIEANQTVMVTVRFAPMEVDSAAFRLNCAIPNLDSGYTPVSIPLKGKVLRPWCHFELPESDYLSAGRRNPEMRGPSGELGPLDPQTRVLEFESLGTKVRNTKRFFILNPTNVAYEFVWEPVERTGAAPLPTANPFKCVNRRGVIMSGRKYEMVFEYAPESDELTETFWRFRIPEQDISVPFLLVGHVLEPAVTLDRASVQFNKVLLGTKARETVHLMNNEEIPFNFAFDKTSYTPQGETGRKPMVEFQPVSGVVQPGQRMPIMVYFTPDQEKSVNYNVVCAVRKKPTRLALNIKGEGYAIHEALQVEMPGGRHMDLSSSSVNPVDFGEVLTNERCVKNVTFVNSGGLSYEFVWDCGSNPSVYISPEKATVAKGQRVVCELSYHPQHNESMENYRIAAQVVNGSKYQLSLSGVAQRPKLQFSFHQHDFGPSFLYTLGMPKTKKMLVVSNDDQRDISFDCLFDNTDWLEVECASTVLAPGESIQIPVLFMPREEKEYAAKVKFEINGLNITAVSFTGEGTPLKVELVNSAQGHLNFGALRIGEDASKTVKVVNRSKIPTTLSLAPSDVTLKRLGMTIMPPGDILLRARETASFTITFRPLMRMRPFHEELLVDYVSVQRPLLEMAGACLGIEVKLTADSLPFGPVVQGAQLVRQCTLENTGDVGTKYAWAVDMLRPHFSISPEDGFIAPNQDIKFDVRFHPQEESSDIRVDRVVCNIEGGEPQYISFSGACVSQESEPTVVNFKTSVRKTESKNITISNPTSASWSLRPTIDNDNWSGPEFFEVPANNKADYPVTYSPTTMAGESEPHTGSVFFPLQDGTAKLYKLMGLATDPQPVGSVDVKASAKTACVELLKVTNWLNSPQRFKAVIEFKAADPSISMRGPDFIDVPALSEKEYKLHFYAYKEGVTTGKVTLKNEQTGEYMYYNVTFTAGKPAIMGTIPLQCPVRTRISHTVVIENPLKTDVTLTHTCPHGQISLSKPKIDVKANSQVEIPIAFRPVVAEEREVMLTLTCPELGDYVYKLVLQSTQAGVERSLTFNVPLGSRETQPFRFMHYVVTKAEYACEFSKGGDAGFEVEPTVVGHPAGPEGIEMEVEVTFEPTQLGDSFKDQLVVKSPEGGEFLCPVIGRCIPPKPQGPIMIKGRGVVQFKNVFSSAEDFHFATDNPAFECPKMENIASKRTIQLDMSYTPTPDRPKTGKLIITCPSKDCPPWLFYLKGSAAVA
eukprot:gene766-1240_t